MSHESQGLRLSGDVYLQRLDLPNAPVLGPLPAEYVGAAPKSERKTVLDTRRNRRGQVLFALSNPKEPEGKLTLLSAPKKLLAMALLGSEVSQSASSGTVAYEAVVATQDFAFRLANRNIGGLTLVSGARAALTLGTGAAGLAFTAVAPGTAGNSITIAISHPAQASQSLTITVTSSAIAIALATDGTAAAISTAAEVLAALAADDDAAALVSVALLSGQTGTGVPAVHVATALTGGTGGAALVEGTDYEVLDAQEGLVRTLLTSGTVYASYTHGTVTAAAVDFGTVAQLRCWLLLIGTNDASATSETVRWEVADCLLAPNGEINLVGDDPVKVDFTLTPLTPEGATSPAYLSWPTYGAQPA